MKKLLNWIKELPLALTTTVTIIFYSSLVIAGVCLVAYVVSVLWNFITQGG